MAKAGRPKLPKEKVRAVFPIRLSEEERGSIDAAAARDGETTMRWIRKQLLAAASGVNRST
jgi:hypothetical protein